MPDLRNITPLSIEGLADYHCHCDYSIDAKGSIDEYCQAAIQRGLAELCFTTHYDVNPRGPNDDALMSVEGEMCPANDESLALYVEDVRLARERYYPQGLSVVLGLEFGWYSGCEEEVERLKEKFEFDYMLVSVHEIDDICYCCTKRYEQCFSRFSLEQMVERYYRDVVAAARSGLFNTIGHLDYYKKFGELYYGPAIHEAHRPYMAEVFATLRGSGTSLEVNTAARRKGFDTYYPSAGIINAAKKAGVDVLYLGSDAHAPEQVGYDFEAAAAFVPDSVGGCDD